MGKLTMISTFKSILIGVSVISINVFAAPANTPHSFGGGQAASASQMNANFAAHKSAIDDNDVRINSHTVTITNHSNNIASNQTDISNLTTQVNQNTSNITALQALQAGIPGQPFNYKINTAGVTLEIGYTYYITDLIYEISGGVVANGTDCGGASGGGSKGSTLTGNTLNSIFFVSPLVSGTAATDSMCVFTGNQIHLNTPLLVPGNETLTTSIYSIRIIGYRIAL